MIFPSLSTLAQKIRLKCKKCWCKNQENKIGQMNDRTRIIPPQIHGYENGILFFFKSTLKMID